MTFELTVTDDEGLTDTDTVDVRLNGRPTANAGPDRRSIRAPPSPSTAPAPPTRTATILDQWTQTSGRR